VHELYVALVDVSGSTRSVRNGYLPDMVSFARRAARAKAVFYADAIGGAPYRSTRWLVRRDFVSTRLGYAGNDTLADADRDRKAQRTEPELRKLLRRPSGPSGSPILEGIGLADRLAGQFPNATVHIAVFTDAVVVAPDYDIRTMSGPAVRARVVNSWAPTLQHLGGGEMLFVGVGLGSKLSRLQLAEGEALFAALARRCRAQLSVWDTRLA
jgi:hypothetical protein